MKKGNLLTIKQVAEKEGATYIEPEGPWDNFTVTDGRIVTGVNPIICCQNCRRCNCCF